MRVRRFVEALQAVKHWLSRNSPSEWHRDCELGRIAWHGAAAPIAIGVVDCIAYGKLTAIVRS